MCPPEQHIFSDDHLWLLLSVPAYIRETEKWTSSDWKVPYCDEGEATVFEHLETGT